MDIREFSEKLAAATKDMSPEERDALKRMFEGVTSNIAQREAAAPAAAPAPAAQPAAPAASVAPTDPGWQPDGPTPRILALKDNYRKQVPSISTYRARAVTEVTKEHPGMPKIILRAKAFRRCCETAPLIIQDNELIVGNPTGGPRVGAFSPDIAWEWMEDELETIATRDQDPFYISEEDKKYIKEELIPFWRGSP